MKRILITTLIASTVAAFLYVSIVSSYRGRSLEKETVAPANISSVSVNQLSGNVELGLVSPDGDVLRFELKNGLPLPIFVAYSGEKNDDGSQQFVPYFLKCRTAGTARYKDYEPAYHHIPGLASLPLGDSVIFNVDKPIPNGKCDISVPFRDNADAARLVIEKNGGLSKSEQKFVDSHRKSVHLKFDIEQ